MARIRYNNENGTLGAALTNSGTTITFTTAPNFATLTGANYIPLMLDVGTSSFEVVYLTAYTAAATTGTILRTAEDSTNWPAVAHSSGSGTWVVGSTIYDFTTSQITPSVLALSANSATPAIDTDNYTVVHITAQTAAITSFTTNLTGTPVDGDSLRISITGTAAVAITWGASFQSSTAILPTTTVTTARLDVGFFWNTEGTPAWRCVAVA